MGGVECFSEGKFPPLRSPPRSGGGHGDPQHNRRIVELRVRVDGRTAPAPRRGGMGRGKTCLFVLVLLTVLTG